MYLTRLRDSAQLTHLIRHRLAAETDLGPVHPDTDDAGKPLWHLFGHCSIPSRHQQPLAAPLRPTLEEVRDRIGARRGPRLCPWCSAGLDQTPWGRWRPYRDHISWAAWVEVLLTGDLRRRARHWEPHLVENGLRNYLHATWTQLAPVTDPQMAALATHLADQRRRLAEHRPPWWHRRLLDRRDQHTFRMWAVIRRSPLSELGPTGLDEEHWLVLAALGDGEIHQTVATTDGDLTIVCVDADRVNSWHNRLRPVSYDTRSHTADDVAAALALVPDGDEYVYRDLLRAVTAARS